MVFAQFLISFSLATAIFSSCLFILKTIFGKVLYASIDSSPVNSSNLSFE